MRNNTCVCGATLVERNYGMYLVRACPVQTSGHTNYRFACPDIYEEDEDRFERDYTNREYCSIRADIKRRTLMRVLAEWEHMLLPKPFDSDANDIV